jgi:hypothetical protein
MASVLLKVSVILKCYIVQTGKDLPTFRTSTVPSTSGLRSPEENLFDTKYEGIILRNIGNSLPL